MAGHTQKENGYSHYQRITGILYNISLKVISNWSKNHPTYSARKLAEVIGITPKAVEKHLAKLKAEGLIKREGPDKGGYWTVL